MIVMMMMMTTRTVMTMMMIMMMTMIFFNNRHLAASLLLFVHHFVVYLLMQSTVLPFLIILGRKRGRGWMPAPVTFFWIFFSWKIKHQHQTFSVAVCSSLAHFLRQVQWWSVAMVTRYDVISSRRSSHFWVKIHVFSTSFNNKSKSCG